MRLVKARVKGYRSIKDTGYFEIEKLKTILVGPNESGKTAILQALQKLNPPKDIPLFDPLRDYPRSDYDAHIKHNGLDISKFTVVEGYFELEDVDKEKLPDGFKDIVFVYGRYLNNKTWRRIDGGLKYPKYSILEKDLNRMATHFDTNYQIANTQSVSNTKPSDSLNTILNGITLNTEINLDYANKIISWLTSNFKYVNEDNAKEDERFDKIKNTVNITLERIKAIDICEALMPTFILFNNYFRIKPSIHLQKLAERTEQNLLDDNQYDYGNNCLLKYLGFSARELSTAGDTSRLNLNDPVQFEKYKAQLDDRTYSINAATIRLTNEIINVWNPQNHKKDANRLRIVVDGQYLKVVVEDELGVEVEIDQRSEGFQWLVSFFIVFFAEADDKHKNAILLLDEPGMSLHALKQAEFLETLTKLSEKNQTIFSTHSPFLIGVNELDKVRVVEMVDRNSGTKVNTSLTASDSGALLPLQEALGYDLAQSLFFHKKNLVLEGLTDYWYIEAASELLKENSLDGLDSNIALLPANCASKVVYYATILRAQNLKVAALLDSDSEGDLAASQDTLVNVLGSKKILRTKDVYKGKVIKCEVEDIFRDTLVSIAKDTLGWDATSIANVQTTRPIVDILSSIAGDTFSKFKLAKAFLRWSREHTLADLTQDEQIYCNKLITIINKSLK
jgi:predicted ATP-dependent endonuclease of OLD family